MSDSKGVRAGEMVVDLPNTPDAGVFFIGAIHTPYKTVGDCPRNRLAAGETQARIEIDKRYAAALEGVELFSHLHVFYWMDEARRDVVLQTPRHLDKPRGAFALRSPVRPNPISMSVVELYGVAGTTLRVSAIECRDGTPLLDIKPYFASTDSVPDAKRP